MFTLLRLIPIIFVLLITTSNAYAWGGYDWNIFSEIKKATQNFIEDIVDTPKQEMILEHLAEWQEEKEKLIQNNQPVPEELQKTIDEKQAKLERIDDDSTNALSSIVDTIMIGQELGKIREYVSEFHDLKTNNISVDERPMAIQKLQTNVNQLNLVKKHCFLVSVNDLLNSNDPYETLVSYCDVLKTVPKELVMNTLNE